MLFIDDDKSFYSNTTTNIYKNSNTEECYIKDAIFPVWAFGFNNDVPVVNLSNDMQNIVVYASAHLLIMYDATNHTQKILKGHVNI